MTDNLPPAPKFRIRRWVIASVVSTSLFCGAFSAVAVLFLADRFFDVGQNPAVQEQPTASYDPEFDQRLRALEENATRLQQAAAQQQAAPIEQNTMPQHDVAVAAKTEDNTATRIMIGLTQLKNAYENDAPLTQGINTLKEAVTDDASRQALDDLERAAAENPPSDDAIRQQIQAVHDELQPPAANTPVADGDWKARASGMLHRFVTVQDTADLQQKKTATDTLERISQAVSIDQYAQAADMAANLPETAQTKILLVQLQTRMKIQQLVKKAVTTVDGTLGQLTGKPRGALY